MTRTSLRALPLLLCLSFTACDRPDDQLSPEKAAALARAEEKRIEEAESAEREREREANRKRMIEQLRQEEEEEKLRQEEKVAQKRREDEKAEPMPAQELAEHPQEEEEEEEEEEPSQPSPPPSFLPDANAAAEQRQIALDEKMDEAVALRKEALRILGEQQVRLTKLQEIARHENSITGNMKKKKQADANVARQELIIKRAEQRLQAASETVKRLRDARLGF